MTDHDELPTLPIGFELEVVDTFGLGWVRITHECGDFTGIANPTQERVDWSTGIHRCGDGDWHEGPPEGPPDPAGDLDRLMHLMTAEMGRYTGEELADLNLLWKIGEFVEALRHQLVRGMAVAEASDSLGERDLILLRLTGDLLGSFEKCVLAERPAGQAAG